MINAAKSASGHAGAVARLHEGVKVASADNLSSHSSFGSACTTKTRFNAESTPPAPARCSFCFQNTFRKHIQRTAKAIS
jgi:hypothetical protein